MEDLGSAGATRFADRQDEVKRERELVGTEENIQWAEQAEIANARKAEATTQQKEMDELRATMRQTAADLKEMRSQVHHATSKAPEIDRVLEEAQTIPFIERITKARLSDSGKIRIPAYEGKTYPTEHITSFSIAMGRAFALTKKKSATVSYSWRILKDRLSTDFLEGEELDR